MRRRPLPSSWPGNPTRGGGRTIRGSCGRGQHVTKAVDLPGTNPSLPTRRSSLPAVVQECRRRSLLAPSGRQSVDRVQAIAGWQSRWPLPKADHTPSGYGLAYARYTKQSLTVDGILDLLTGLQTFGTRRQNTS